MACKPSIDILYGHLNNRLKKNMSAETPAEFNLVGYMRQVNTIMSTANPDVEDIGIINAQAVPQLLSIIMASNKAIRDYLKGQNINIQDVVELSDKFNEVQTGLDSVKDYIKEIISDPADIKRRIKALNKSNFDIPLVQPTDIIMFAKKGGQKPTSVATTTGQGAVRVNPETATDEEKNVIDPEKTVFGIVVKTLVDEARKRPTDDVTTKYQGVDVYLRPIVSSLVFDKYFTSEDKKAYERSKDKDGIVAFVTDSFGNMLFFDDNGDITTSDKGKPVYQYLRRVTKIKNKLAISNNSDWYYSLVSPVDITNQMIMDGELNGITFTKARKEEMLKEVTEQQQKEVNQLYNLRNIVLENPDKVYTLPITGGSFGVVNTKQVPLSDTDITEDEITDLRVVDDINSARSGWSTFILSRANDKLAAINNTVYVNRGNFDTELAGKIADVITTTGKLNGRELSAKDRYDFTKAFLSNAITDNKIKIELDESTGVEQLIVFVKGKEVTNLQSPAARKTIFDHLMSAIEWQGKSVSRTYSANVNFNKDLLGKTYIDYTIDGDKITSESKNYFDSIKKYMLVEYSKESLPAVTSLNGYLKYAMPENLQPAAQQKVKRAMGTPDVISDNVGFEVTEYDNQKKVTEALVENSDAVISIASDFESTTETLLQKISGGTYSGLPITKRLEFNIKAIKSLVIDKLNNENADTVFFTGNDISILAKDGITQPKIDKFMLDVLTALKESEDLKNKDFTIVTNGQTGVSEAVIKASSKLGIPTRVLTTSNWSYRTAKKATSKTAKNFADLKGKDNFLKRFGIKSDTVEIKESTIKTKPVKGTNKGVPKGKVDPTSTLLFDDDDFSDINDISLLKRSKSLGNDYGLSDAEEKKIIDWYESTPLAKLLPLSIVTALVNSDAFAQFSRHGLTLFKGDGGTALDIYHEAWHGFSQLFLTKTEKVNLYNSVAKASNNPRWNPATTTLSKTQIYFEIEESLAEGFRDYKAGKYKPKTKEEKSIFKRILDFLMELFRGSEARDVEFHVADLASVRELYDKLYMSSTTPEVLDTYSPSMNNAMFFKLNRSKTIQSMEETDSPYTKFTIDESILIKDTMDSMLVSSFRQFNQSNDTASGAIDQLKNTEKRLQIYEGIRNQFIRRAEQLETKYNQIKEENEKSDNPRTFIEEQLAGKLDLVNRIIEDFGDIEEAIVNKKYDKGVVSYHLANTRFPVLKEKIVDLEDTTEIAGSQTFRDNSGENSSSPRDYLNKDTEMILASVFKTQITADGERKMIPNALGYFELESPEIVWSRLARTLESSMNPADMYTKLVEYSETYPEFSQVLGMLPALKLDPSLSETQLETQFWQDLKKPRIQYTELNLNPVEGEKNQDGTPKFTSNVLNASTDTFSVMREWSNNFINEQTKNNPFIFLDNSRNMLDLNAIVQKFGPNGVLNKNLAQDFLSALGIELDKNSAEIKLILSKDFFIQIYGVDRMFNIIKKLNDLRSSKDKAILAAIQEFQSDPIKIFREGFKDTVPGISATEVNNKIKLLAALQNQYADAFSNFSAYTPEMNRVFEHFLDSTATRNILALNKALNWSQAVGRTEADPNGVFKHMRWLAEENNTFSNKSIIIRSMFNLNQLDPGKYGERITTDSAGKIENSIKLQVVSGTKVFDQNNRSEGISTSSSDTTTKYLQEMNTMLLRGIQEFMRHASKSLSLGLQANELIFPYPKQNKNLYVDIQDFKTSTMGRGEQRAFDILLGYIAGEHERINRFNSNKSKYEKWAGYNREIQTRDGKTVMAAEVFTAFDDVLTEDTKNKLYAVKENLLEYLAKPENAKLKEQMFTDVKNYFNDQTTQNLDRLQEARYVDDALYKLADSPNTSQLDVDRVLTKAYTYNAWIHNFETTIIGYGDLVQYNHAKEEFHKRNAGWGGSGNGFRSDPKIQSIINDREKFKRYYLDNNPNKGWKVNRYDGTLNTAILEELKLSSKYYAEYKAALKKDILDRIKDNKSIKDKEAYAEKVATNEVNAYEKMDVADGQGYITMESYRMLKFAEGNWSKEQEALYRKVSRGEPISTLDVMEFFPSYKLQYFGNIETEGLPLTSFHKFSLTPLIPTVVKNSKLETLQDMMMKQGVDYALFQSGSKVGHISSNNKGTGDRFLNEDGSVDTKTVFTSNKIFAENLKNVTSVNSTYKKSTIFSTQLRKLILEGLYERGIITSKNEKEITQKKVQDYINRVDEYSALLKYELLNEIGFEEVDGEYIPTDKNSTEKLAELIRNELTRDDVIGDHLIDFIDVNQDGKLKYDLSLHPEGNKIEKLILSIINKRLVKQKVFGEPLVQVSSAMYDVFDNTKFKNAKDSDIKKYVGTNFLPTYHEKVDGKTAAMKVMIALQGDFLKLLKLKDNTGKEIGNIDRLNELIKDDAWLDANDGANRKAITMAGVRIPVQGLNSMEFMEVYHFLPEEAGNLIIPPPEIVAKSGADFDIDKLTIFMPNLTARGKVVSKAFNTTEDFRKAVEEAKKNGEDTEFIFERQKKSVQNELLQDIKNILELPENFASLIRPNTTDTLKGYADDLSQYVMKYDPYRNMNDLDEEGNVSKYTTDKKGKKLISPTRVLEVGYNLYKHESNVIGKRTLGLGAIENTFNVLFNALGAAMPKYYMQRNELVPREMRLFLRHNTLTNKDGDEVISISDRYDVDKKHKIADLFSQAINGWVDVEKDAWVFFIQGNYEVAPILLYLLQTGVPVDEAIYFVSQPLVREYVKEQRLAKSTFAEILGKKPEKPYYFRADASRSVMKKFFDGNIKAKQRYMAGTNAANELFEGRKEKAFTKNEMYQLVKDSKTDPKAASSDLSKAMFLHFLEIEQQIDGIKALKFAFNQDTNLKSTLGAVEQAEYKIEELATKSSLDQDLKDRMANESVVSSFKVGPLALAITRPLYPLMYHKTISDWMIRNNAALDSINESTFNDKDKLITTFRNDLVSMLLQNALRKYNIEDFYKSYALSTTIPREIVDKLNRGAFVKENAQGIPTLYLDADKVKEEYNKKLYTKTAKGDGSYTSLNLYPLDTTNFTNQSEYLKFVAEREYLRFVIPMSEASFSEELAIIKSENPDLSADKQQRLGYEKFLAERALENSFNPIQIFKNKKSAFALRYANIIKDNPELSNRFEVLKKLKVDFDSKRNRFNLYVNERKYTNSLSNLYYKNLQDLANPKIVKVPNLDDNLMLSQFFAKFPLYSFFQSGLNKNKLNFVGLVDYNPFMDVVQNESEEFMKILDDPEAGNDILNAFAKVFGQQNAYSNRERFYFKNYFFANDMKSLVKSGESIKRYGLTQSLTNPQVFKYSNLASDKQHYSKLVESNPDILFVHNMINVEAEKPSMIFSGQNRLRILTPLSQGIITSNARTNDNFTNVATTSYQNIKDSFENSINNIKNQLANGTSVAFSKDGYGDPLLMPEELFVYLSKRLYEEFRYVNPGSTKYQEVMDTINRVQGISDAEILSMFDDENNPFKCSI